MSRKHCPTQPMADTSLARLACPNADCTDFNRFGAGNLSIVQRGGKKQATRRLYCRTCGQRFGERKGTLLEGTKLPLDTVVRIVKCLGHGCTVEAAADICEVDPRTIERLLEKAGLRADGFHNLDLGKINQVEAVELDELHGRVSPTPAKKGGLERRSGLVGCVAAWVVSGFTQHWL
jgi:transposase-like protein